MYLKSLHIEDWRAIGSLDVPFEPGLNIIHGPNESGKSSLREALRCAFVYPSRPRGKSDVSSARPWGTKKKPLVEVRFFHQESEWMVRKVFFTDDSELQCDGRLLAQGTTVQNELTKILATDGLSALWSVQGEPDSPGVPGDLRGQFAAAEAITPGSHWLIGQIEERFGHFWTAKTQRPRPPLSEVRDASHAAEERVGELEDKLLQANELSRQTDAQDDGLLELRKRHQEASEQFTQQKEKLRANIARLEQSLERAYDWEKKWNTCWSRVKQAYQKQQEHEARVAEQKELLGDQPSRDELENLRHKETYLLWLAQQKLRSELAALGETELPLKRLEEIESKRQQLENLLDLLDQDSSEVKDGDGESGLSQREAQLSELETELEKISRDLESWSVAERDKERLESKLDDFGNLVESWSEVSEGLCSAWEELQTYQERLQTLKDEVGTEPDREEVEALQRQQSYLQFALHRKLTQELSDLKAPNSDTLAEMVADQQKLESLKERLKEAPAAQSFTSSPQFPKVIALGAGVWFLSVLYGNSQELGAFMTLLLPAVLFGVIVLVGFLFFGASASRVASDSDDLENRAEELEKSLAARFKDYGCETVGQARTVAERRQVLQAQLEAAPSGDPDALLNSDEDKAGIDALDAEQLRAKIKAMPAQLEKAESEWKERQTVHAKSRTAYEALLKDSPESRVDTLLQQMTRLAKHERLAGCDVPKKCHPEWIEQLKTASPIAAVVEEMGGFREALESLEHPGSEQVEQTRARFESLKAEIKVSRESLDVVKAEALATRGAGEARIAQIQRLVEKTAYLREEVASGLNLNQDTLPELRERATCARRQLEEQTEALYREVDVESKEQLEAKDEQRRSLKPLLKQDLDAPEDLSQLVACVDPDGQLESLSRLQISQRLAGLDKEKEEAEAAWKEQNQSYAAQREQFEALLKEDPRGSLIGAYEQLKELGQDSEAARVKLPDEFDPSVLEGPGSPDQQWRDLQSQREEQVGEFRLLLGAPEQASSDDPLRIAYDALRETREELEINSGQLHQSVGTMTAHEELYAELCRAQEELRDALRKQRQVEVEANGLVLLRNALLETQQVLEDELVSPLRERISERLDKLTHGAYRDIRISTDFTPQELLTPDEQSAPVEDLSFGTREQVAFLSRLCLADLLSETERQVVVFDDSLVHTDDKRMLVACELLHEAAQISQVIILTCHPERFETLLDEAHVVDLAMGSPAGAP